MKIDPTSNPKHPQYLDHIGPDNLKKCLAQMLLIRNFELRAEAAYQQGKIGGFFHAYIGQEAIQTAALLALGPNNWFATSYRCHALALLLGATPEELMAELFGRAAGNAKGRGGSMHFFTERLLGGFGIVTGQVPIATGAGFTLKYRGNRDEVSICFLGDGAVPQGSFHESLNLASLWNLPCIYVIENNLWGMGTAVEKAVCVPCLAEDKAPGYNMKSYTFDGWIFLPAMLLLNRCSVKSKKHSGLCWLKLLPNDLRDIRFLIRASTAPKKCTSKLCSAIR